MAVRTPRDIGKPKKSVAEKADAASLRSGKAARVVSLSAFQALTGYDRGTVARWIKAGLKPERTGGKGEAVFVDVRDVIRWIEEQAENRGRAEGRKEAASDTSSSDPADLDADLKREQIRNWKVKTATQTGLLVPAPAVEQVIAVVINSFRIAVSGLDVRIERDLVGFPADNVRKAKDDIRENCRSALQQAQSALEKGVRQLTKQRLLDIGAEVDEYDEEEDPFDADE